jgi:hypothetical protein
MTFCFAFSANPDGIAVVADTRLSYDNNGFSDTYQKVFFPTEDSFIAVSGVLGTFSFLLENIGSILSPVAFDRRIDFLRRHLRQRYIDGIDKRQFEGSPDDAFLIYGDVRFDKGTSRSRLVRFNFQFRDGTVVFGEKSSPKFGWCCIGSAPPTRHFLANTAADCLMDLEERSLVIRADANVLNVTAGRVPYLSLDRRGAVFDHPGGGAVVLDSSGPKNGTFRKTLRAFANQQEASGSESIFEPIQVFGSAALKAIADQVAEFRNPPAIGIETISDTWTLATISRRNGIRLFTGNDPHAAMQQFGLNSGLR